MKRIGILGVLFACYLTTCGAAAWGEVQIKAVSYHDGETLLQGFLAVPDKSFQGPRSAVLVFHDWMGMGDFSKARAARLAEAGYVAFAADVYGAGVVAKDSNEAGTLAGKYKQNRALMRSRAHAAFDTLSAVDGVAKSKIGAIGFCFGGTVALELARMGAPLAGVVSFHGGLETPTPAKGGEIKGKILALHGAEDPFVGPETVKAFETEMRSAHVDYKLIKYPGAVHAFTNPAAGNDNSKGAAYNAQADKLSYVEMERFFTDLFSK